jgi:hypothetical protein
MNDITALLLSPTFRPAIEVLALVLCSSLLGFLIARSMYRTKVETRTDHLRLEQTRWRRRLSHSSSNVVAVANERDRSQRKLRRARADKTGTRPPGSVEKAATA